MAVGEASTDFSPVPGVRLSAVACGIKSSGGTDLVLFEFVEGSTCAGVFTQSLFAAAPVLLGREHLARANPRYFLINSGNANAGVGEAGVSDAFGCCQALSQLSGSHPESVLPFSTGVIGERLQVENITNALPGLINSLDENNWLLAACGIMTTDTRPKIESIEIVTSQGKVTLTGIAKGAGMIQPNMATLLCYMAMDAKVTKETLNDMLGQAVDQSFNRITVDSDTSTNDSCMITATGLSGVDVGANEGDRKLVQDGLNALARKLAHGIVRDAEGATKFVEVRVEGGQTQKDCLAVAYAIANSPLMKTALFASDANWGRIVMAIGKAEATIDVNLLDVFLGDVQLMKQGQKNPDYREEMGGTVMAEDEILIHVNLNLGAYAESVWTSDLSHEYVRINAEYRT